jgi:shikimate kinase
LENRLQHKQDRPLLAQGSLASTLTHQLSQREAWYQESEIQIDAGADSPEELAQKILQKLPA